MRIASSSQNASRSKQALGLHIDECISTTQYLFVFSDIKALFLISCVISSGRYKLLKYFLISRALASNCFYNHPAQELRLQYYPLHVLALCYQHQICVSMYRIVKVPIIMRSIVGYIRLEQHPSTQSKRVDPLKPPRSLLCCIDNHHDVESCIRSKW